LAQPPSPSPRRCFLGRGWPSRGPICFVFSLHFFVVFFFYFYFVFFLFFTSIFCDFFQKVSSFGSPNSDRGPTLSAGHLSTWQAWASTLHVLLRLHGFASDLTFQV
jgi:hypothetical protein